MVTQFSEVECDHVRFRNGLRNVVGVVVEVRIDSCNWSRQGCGLASDITGKIARLVALSYKATLSVDDTNLHDNNI